MCAVVLGMASVSAMADITVDSVSFAATTTTKPAATGPVVQNWMHTDVGTAWGLGYKGQGTTITIVDDFTSNNKFGGNLGTGALTQRHGDWTKLESSLIAPSAAIKTIDYNSSTKFTPVAGQLNVVNASYGLMAPAGYNVKQINFGTLHNSVIAAAKAGTAVIAKAAGNSAVAVDGVKNGQVDYMNLALKGAPSVVYVGALEKHGSTTAKAKLASYSNFAGNDVTIQNRFLVIGVDTSKMGIAGTSFAAPQLAAYSAVLGSKFTKANATQISNQLLNTARTDTIANYSKAVHGKGEASLSRALAPTTIK